MKHCSKTVIDSSTVDYCKTFNSNFVGGSKVEPSSPSGAVDNDSRLHHSLLSSCYRPLTLSLQSQVVYIIDIYKVFFIQAVFSFQEDDGGGGYTYVTVRDRLVQQQ